MFKCCSKATVIFRLKRLFYEDLMIAIIVCEFTSSDFETPELFQKTF